MAAKQTQEQEKQGVSKVKIVVGAASLFLFIVGLKRTFRMDEAQDGRTLDDGDGRGGSAAR